LHQVGDLFELNELFVFLTGCNNYDKLEGMRLVAM